MSTDEYVPSDDQVRGRYCDGTYTQTGHTTEGDDFDAWLARVRRYAAREALDGLAAEAREGIVNRETTWGHGQSIASAAGTYRDTHYPEETP